MDKTITVPSRFKDDLKNLRMFDDNFFRIVCNDKRVVKVILDTIFGDDIFIIDYRIQNDLNYSPKKSIISDIFVITNYGYMNIEVEKHKERLVPKRARYNASILDVDISIKGMEYRNMKPIKVIFICEFDSEGRGLPVYHIKDFVEEIGTIYDDEREYIYINGNYTGNDRIGKLVHDLKQTKANDMYIDELRDVMKYYKESKEGIEKMCEIFENIERRSKDEEKKEIATKMLKDNLKIDIVVKYSGLTKEEVILLKKSLTV